MLPSCCHSPKVYLLSKQKLWLLSWTTLPFLLTMTSCDFFRVTPAIRRPSPYGVGVALVLGVTTRTAKGVHHFAEAPKREGKLRGKKRTRQRRYGGWSGSAGRRTDANGKDTGAMFSGDPQPEDDETRATRKQHGGSWYIVGVVGGSGSSRQGPAQKTSITRQAWNQRTECFHGWTACVFFMSSCKAADFDGILWGERFDQPR